MTMNLREAAQRWEEMTRKKEEMEEKILQLLRHPEATPEHLAQCQSQYREMCKLYVEVKEALCQKYPKIHGLTPTWAKRG